MAFSASLRNLTHLGAVFSPTVDERRPSKILMLLEGRAGLEWASTAMALPWLLRCVPRGDGVMPYRAGNRAAIWGPARGLSKKCTKPWPTCTPHRAARSV